MFGEPDFLRHRMNIDSSGGGNVEIPTPVIGGAIALIATLSALLKRALKMADKARRPPPIDSDKNLRELFLEFRDEQRLHNRQVENQLEDIVLDVRRHARRLGILEVGGGSGSD